MHFLRISFYLMVLLPFLHSAVAGDGPLYKPVKYERKYPDVGYEKDWMPEMNAEKYGRFFVVSNNFIITGANSQRDDSIVETWLKMKDKRWLSVDVVNLKQFGIKKNDAVKYVDFQTGKLESYTFKDKVNIALVPSDFYGESPDIPFHRTFYILLNDVISTAKSFEVSNSDEVTGLAYIGDFYELLETPEKFPEAKIVSEVTAEVSKSLDLANYSRANQGQSETTPKKITTYSFGGIKFFEFEFNERPLKISNSVSKNGKYHSVSNTEMDSDLTKFYKRMIYFKDSLLFIHTFDGMHSCLRFQIFKDGEFKKFDVKCDSGGC